MMFYLCLVPGREVGFYQNKKVTVVVVLSDYLKHLEPDAPDRKDAQSK